MKFYEESQPLTSTSLITGITHTLPHRLPHPPTQHKHGEVKRLKFSK